MKWLYAAFDLGVAAGPLAVTLIWLRDFWRQWRALVASLLFIGVPWILLDIVAYRLGWWSYNQQYISGVRLFDLPIEEILFFVVVPFACLVVWWVLRTQTKAVAAWLPRTVLLVVAISSFGLALISLDKPRTVLDVGIAVLTVYALWNAPLVLRRNWWYWNGAVLVLFLICNTLLTAVPIVEYNNAAMTGWRVGTIPIEDFLYNFSLLNLTVLIFSRWGRAKEDRAVAAP